MRDAVLHETRSDVGVSGACGGAAAGFGLGWADGTAGLGGWTACRSRTASASSCCRIAVWVRVRVRGRGRGRGRGRVGVRVKG